jgi:hypothetical protein
VFAGNGSPKPAERPDIDEDQLFQTPDWLDLPPTRTDDWNSKAGRERDVPA